MSVNLLVIDEPVCDDKSEGSHRHYHQKQQYQKQEQLKQHQR